MVEGLTRAEDGEGDSQICEQENAVTHPYANLQMGNSGSVDQMLAKCDNIDQSKRDLFIRQPSIQSRDTDFQTPKNGGVQRPSDHLDFRAHDAVIVFIGVDVEVRTLLGCHVTVCETSELGANEICCDDLCGEQQLLDVSVSICGRPDGPCVHEMNKSAAEQLTPVSGIK
jgi:hypothetical protein